MSQTISSNPTPNTQAKKPKYWNRGVVRASYAASLAAAPLGIASFGVLGKMMNVSKLSKQDSVQLSKATQDALKQTGLYEKGVRAYKVKDTSIINIIKKIRKNNKNALKSVTKNKSEILEGIKKSKANQKSSPINLFRLFAKKKKNPNLKAENAMRTELMSNKRVRKYLDYCSKTFGIDSKMIADGMVQNQMMQFKFGMNAAFLPNANKIITPTNSLQTSVFHEIGHALNYNGGGILKGLQKCRPLAMIVPGAVLAISLFNKRKTTDPKLENNSFKNKVQNFADTVKKNAATITGLSMMPMLIEEGIASIRGGKLAKNMFKQNKISKNILKKVHKTNLAGFATYAIGVAAAMLTAKVAVNVKDKIQAKYEAKKLAKFEAKMQNA